MRYFKDNKVVQKRLAKILAKMAQKPHVVVGILQDSPVSDGFTVVDLAIVHEFGSQNGRIPQRSFMRSTCDSQSKKYSSFIQTLQNKLVSGTLSIKKALTQLGEVVSKDIVQTINRGIDPGLNPATIKRKKSSKPLIDTGRLKGSVTHDVRGVS